MKNKKVLLLLIGLILLAVIGFSFKDKLFKFDSSQQKAETKENKESPVHQVPASKDPHAGHNHNHAPDIEPIIPEGSTKLIEGDFTQPLFCNNGEHILFTDAKGNKLYYQKDAESTPIILLEQSSVGNNIGWSKDCETVYYKEKTKDYRILIKSINVNTKEIKEYPSYPPQIELRSIAISDTIYYLDSKTLAVRAMHDNNKWDISTEKGNYYKLLISPNNKYIVAHLSANVMLFSTDGTFIKDLGRGIATDWSPDSKKLIGFLDETSDGHDVSGSELYYFNLEGASPTQITSTNNAIEMWPVYKNQQQIVYTDELNEGIFIKNI